MINTIKNLFHKQDKYILWDYARIRQEQRKAIYKNLQRYNNRSIIQK